MSQKFCRLKSESSIVRNHDDNLGIAAITVSRPIISQLETNSQLFLLLCMGRYRKIYANRKVPQGRILTQKSTMTYFSCHPMCIILSHNVIEWANFVWRRLIFAPKLPAGGSCVLVGNVLGVLKHFLNTWLSYSLFIIIGNPWTVFDLWEVFIKANTIRMISLTQNRS